MSILEWFNETTEDGKEGLLVRSSQIGLAWMMADEAAKALGKKLRDQHPQVILRENLKYYFFEYAE